MSDGTTTYTAEEVSRTTHRSPTAPPLPPVIYLLGFALFAMGTSEFLIAGVLPAIAADLSVSLPSAGTLISAFAIGVLVGAPPLALLTLKWPRRFTLFASQLLFVAATALGLLAGDYTGLLVARVVTGVAYAGFWAVAATTAVELAPQGRQARALSIVVSGLSLAMVAGGPLGTFIGGLAGWRAGFWAVVVMTSLSALAVIYALPRAPQREMSVPDLKAELSALSQGRIWIAYSTTMLTTAAYMVSFGYLAALLIEISALPSALLPVVLALFGIGAFLGLLVGGRTADAFPFATIGAGIAGLFFVSLALTHFAADALLTAGLVFLLGFAGFLVNPAVIGRVYTIAANAPTLPGAVNVSAFQLGITLAPLLGGIALNAGFGLASIGMVGAATALAAALPAYLDARWNKPQSGNQE